MREDIKVTKVYRFEELSEKAQEKVMEKLCEVNVDYEWWENVYEDARNIGVEIKKFNLGQGSYCQGRFLQSEFDVAEEILEGHGKDCETYKDAYEFVWTMAEYEDGFYDTARKDATEEGIEFVLGDYDDFDPSMDTECPDELEGFQRTIFEDYRIILQKEYDYLTSEEAIRETIDANDYEFTEDGRIYR